MKSKNKSMIDELREIRDQISLDTMNMTFEELENYFAQNKKVKVRSKKAKASASLAAEQKGKYRKR